MDFVVGVAEICSISKIIRYIIFIFHHPITSLWTSTALSEIFALTYFKINLFNRNILSLTLCLIIRKPHLRRLRCLYQYLTLISFHLIHALLQFDANCVLGLSYLLVLLD